MKYICILFVLSAVLLSCADQNGPKTRSKAKTYTLVNKGEKHFYMDSVTTPIAGCVDYYEDGNRKYFMAFSPFTNHIGIYDYTNGQFIKGIELKNVIHEKLSYSKIINWDSILCYSYSSGKLYIVDSSAVLHDSIQLKTPVDTINKIYYPSPFPTTFSGMFCSNGTLYTIGWIGGEPADDDNNKRPVLTTYSKTDKKPTWHIQYPDVYKNKNWGGFYFRTPYFAENRDELVVSFPATSSLFVYDKNSLALKYTKEVSSEQETAIKPLTLGRNTCISNKASAQHYSTTFSYADIIYDKYKKVYYRFAELPVSIHSCSRTGMADKPKIVQILDEQLNYLGEISLPQGTSKWTYFISRDGLYLLDYLNKNENIAKYYQYEIVKV